MIKCPFCSQEIINRQKIFETESEYVFYNIRNSNKGRCLVIPKRHIASLDEMTDEELISFFKTVRLVAQKLKDYLSPAGINYGLNEGDRAGQTIKHMHFHIIPRFDNDSFPHFHLFHGDKNLEKDLTLKEIKLLRDEFTKIF